MTAPSAYYIPPGDAGTMATVAMMQRLSRQSAVTPEVRRVAARLVMGAGRNAMMHARLLRDWIDANTEFLADPSVAEALVPPSRLVGNILRDGLGQVDCDDVAMLAASLGLSIGLRARFVVVGFHGPSGAFGHVWAELGSPDGNYWLPIDPTRPAQGLPNVSRSIMVEV